jgi:hypothetical protein
MQGVRVGLHAGNPGWRADGVVRRRLRGLLPIWRGQAVQGGGMNVAPFIKTRRLGKVSVGTVTLAHGGGGKAMKDLIDDVFVAAFDNRGTGAAGGSGAVRSRRACAPMATGWRSPPIPSWSIPCSSRRRHRQARGLRHGQRPRGRRRQAAVSVLRVIVEEGTARRSAAPGRALDGGNRRQCRRPTIVTGDTKVVQRGACDKFSSPPPASA